MVGQVGCLAYTDSVSTSYGYRPSLAAGIVFTILFTLSTGLHIYQLVPKRAWWLIVFVVGGLGMLSSLQTLFYFCKTNLSAGELMGWAARVAAFKCPYNGVVFEMQLACLIICTYISVESRTH